ncbi:MAG: hypothetical protein A3H88_01990 [Candidatus Blackburnbacteria bacterium RIFCSPLOWO2_02_FULL_44_9]|nr:MAG: hypothetical protein A3E16_02280 [Candidatus Blackburnbacteria bacterium RIFCSPHIGHO2_12_FULL_44_25]OGY15467.1 MAG: hypothetical protein A3H88_01990 [Candidatus Blackburnbacteria bacterium RIFCSPLOWO2_02_FULL_44_9]
MTILPHVVVGGLIGSYTNSVSLAIAGGVASHLVLDFIPHYDHPIGKDHLRSFAAFYWWGSNIISVGVLWFLYGVGIPIFVGALSAALVDIENLVCMFTGYGLKFHRTGFWHRKTTPLRGFMHETAIVLVGLVWLYLRLTG